ncbi:septation protein SepH [Corynebacterium pelargi]|uniref:Uncharacterized protein n=1 Tax=Corynebacterium pelargi TaxID=1471400 RepID=A0A410WA60_9CORY|nr:septation protein SepH [Corynebacterium pelargi]QAU52829.1 hypothetical protein CPELA_07850 [Corynebacterium pelargi]GGG79044.1 hypothetical protein GCM10007338_16610 [Corynebacterium pelargi]
MRELRLIPEESTHSSLVFEASDNQEQFFLAVDDSLREALQVSEPAATEQDASEEEQPKEPEVQEAPKPARNQKEVDPRLTNPLKMRPREIQERLRRGGTIAELAEENGVTESRIEPFAHPVLLERSRIANMAKQSNPVRDDGPAQLTLWEILATAFAARGMELQDATWDAYRDSANQWVIKVTWQSGLSEQSAEWNFVLHGAGAKTTVARNAVAADLIDPNFAQPVRNLSAVQEQTPVEEDEAEETTVEGELLQHPEPQPRKRRKAVTPSWEDVLLGVRTNTKRPRS